MRFLRPLIGPVIVLASMWCAAGHVTVAADSAAVRIAVPPSFSIAGVLAALVLVAAIAGWRRSPWTAAPALLAVLPWLPGPLPAIALIWTGPLAWLPMLCAAGLAIAVHPPRYRLTGFRVQPTTSAVLAAALAALISAAVAWQLASRLPGGDEPNYLVITQSLLRDGDLKIQNNHDRGDYHEYYGADLRPDYIPLPQVKDVYSIHAPGLAVAVLPGFALAGYRGAQVTVILLAALATALIWLAAFELTSSAGAAWFAWAAATSSLTFLIQSVTIFPDAAGMAAVAAGVWLYTRVIRPDRVPRLAAIASAGAALAALPWLHSRFVVLAAGLGLAIAWKLWTARARLAAFLALPVISAVGWLSFFKVIYGTFSPSAPYGAQPVTFLAYIPGGLTALFVDQQFGLLTFAPVFALGLAALGVRHARLCLAVALAYLAASASYWMWWAGVPAPPARLATATLPLFALPLALARARAGAALLGVGNVLLAATATISLALLAINYGELAWDVRGPSAAWLAWLGPTVDLARGWPSFFWRLTPGIVSTEGAFAAHAIAWVAIWTGAAIVLVRITREWSRRHAEFAVAWWLPLTLMLAVQAGWWLDRAPIVRPLTSQLDALRAIARDVPGLRLAGFGAQPFLGATTAGLRLTVGVPVQPSDEAKWTTAVLDNLPAGVYELVVYTYRPTRGRLLLRSHEADAPFTELTLQPFSRQTFTLQFPAAMSKLLIEPDDTLTRIGGYVEVVPVVIPAHSVSARHAAASPGGALYFLDDEVFIEAGSFWVSGGKTAELIVVVDDGRAAFDLEFTNGAAPNDVVLTTDAGGSTLPLAAAASQIVRVPVPPASRAVRVRIFSPGGFRPSDSGASDSRFLGVRVAVR